MKPLGLAIFLLSISFPLMGQTIDQLIITVQEHDEPPTSKGKRDEYVLHYTRDRQGNLAANRYFRSGKKVRLRKEMLIPKDALRQVQKWMNSNERSFLFESFHSDESVLRERQSDPAYGLLHELPPIIRIEIDSFNFCQPHLMKKTFTIGGLTIRVNLKTREDELSFEFDSSTDRNGKLDLHGYLFCYSLLDDALPNDFPGAHYFSPQGLRNIIMQYFKVIECEGYYYQEYTSRHGERTPVELRQGWDFKRYMIERSARD